MKSKFILFILLGIILSSCVGVSSKGVFGTGVSIAFDPRTVGTQMDDSIMQKNLVARILIKDKKYLLSVRKEDKDQVIESGGSANQLRREYFNSKSKKFSSVANNQ